MIERPEWVGRIEKAWKKVSVVWLTGVRRVGKTTLTRHWGGAHYLNCDLPRVRNQLADPELFLGQIPSGIVIFDEIHRTADPAEILKIAADEFPHLKVLATGSSTLTASRKFSDTLTGRKRSVHLLPVLASEMDRFGIPDLTYRLQRGGLPPALLSDEVDLEFYSEWLDSYFARDIQELFNVGKRGGFLRLCALVLRQSGGLAQITSFAKHTGLSRPTVMSYLDILEATHFARTLRPYHAGGRRELLAQPKIYAFDTGFVAHQRGWETLRPEDCGGLLEHLVLDELAASPTLREVHFWRDKQGREIDFVLPLSPGNVVAIECKWSERAFDTRNLDAFRANYPDGETILMTGGNEAGLLRRFGDKQIRVCGIRHFASLIDQIQADSP
ncbi:ATP-binding protein [Puniceicoccus vermicola]|uniref:ATP-binding protein n=1 Tax=Puniceicoccus vermicola TaxID=388746 RepID=A0A7X1AZ60_9BACT|nr:ATP-binding protein [Puniceicoccus vermicola]MBC2602665.1 ATP-binding protein [Puniceicoccus vermicola]